MSATIEPFYRDLGRRIQQARTHSGMSQEKLGACLAPPVTRASIANIEGGKQRVLAKTLVDLCAALSVRIDELLPLTPKKQTKDIDLGAELRAKLQLSPKGVTELRDAIQRGTARKVR